MAEFDEKLNSLLSNPDAMSRIMQLAQSLSDEEAAPPPSSPPGPPAPAPGDLLQAFRQPSAAQEPPRGSAPFGGDAFSSLAGGADPGLLLKLLPLVQELGSGQNSNARQLLYALRPYLREDRQDKVERALQLARLFHIGKKFLSNWEG